MQAGVISVARAERERRERERREREREKRERERGSISPPPGPTTHPTRTRPLPPLLTPPTHSTHRPPPFEPSREKNRELHSPSLMASSSSYLLPAPRSSTFPPIFSSLCNGIPLFQHPLLPSCDATTSNWLVPRDLRVRVRQQIQPATRQIRTHIQESPGMAELVPLDRSGDWRRRLREEEEVAVGVMGPIPRRQNPLADWFMGNRNGLHATVMSAYEVDQETIRTLLRSGKVDHTELRLYRTPLALLNQGPKIDPVNLNITAVVNDMARHRRTLLRMKLKNTVNVAESKKICYDLIKWPVRIQELQGEVSQLKGRYVRIPPVLVTKVSLLC